MIKVKNVSRTPFTLNLLRGVNYGQDFKASAFEMQVPVTMPDGKAGLQTISRELPASITWAPGQTLEVPEKVREIDQFKRATPRILVVC